MFKRYIIPMSIVGQSETVVLSSVYNRLVLYKNNSLITLFYATHEIVKVIFVCILISLYRSNCFNLLADLLIWNFMYLKNPIKF